MFASKDPNSSINVSTSDICLVTGGAGFIGCAMSKALTEQFRRVVAVDSLHPQIHATRVRPAALHSDVELIVGDITDAEAWAKILTDVRPDVVVHLAAETGTGQSLTESNRHGTTNVCGTTTMLDALNKASITPRRFVLSSSRAVYGEGAWWVEGGEPFYPHSRTREMLSNGIWDFPASSSLPCSAQTTWPQPCSVYGATKLAQEHILAAWCTAFGSEVSVLRLQNVYGPGQSLTNSYTGIVSLFCRLARKRLEIPVYEDGAMLRDFVLIDDVASALVAASRGPCLTHPLDIGTGQARAIGDVARMVSDWYGAPPPRVTGQYRYGDVRHAACDISASLACLLGWRPKFALDEGLPLLISWIEMQLKSNAA